MKKINKVIGFFYVFILLVGLFNMDVVEAKISGVADSPPKGAPNSFDDLKIQLKRDHNGWLDEFVMAPGRKRLNLAGTHYKSKGTVHYGKVGDVKGVTGQSNDKKGGMYRFFGISADGLSPITNEEFPDDLATSGSTGGRNYVSEPWKKGQLTQNYRMGGGRYNTIVEIQNMFQQSSGKVLTTSQARAKLDGWLDGVVDKYAYRHGFWKKNSSSFNRTDKRDHFRLMTPQKRRSVIYISMPPTNYTNGHVNTIHTCGGSVSGYCYDTYHILALADPDRPGGSIAEVTSPDFKAEKLEHTKINTYTYELNFTAKNISGSSVSNSVPTKFQYKVGNGSWVTQEGVYHGMDWKVNKSNKGLLGNIQIPIGTRAGTKVEVRAEINPVEKGKNKRYITEETVNNNTIKKTFYTGETSVCNAGGVGTSKKYGISVCNDWVKGEDGNYSCGSKVCQYTNYSLNNLAEADYKTSKQTLVGAWSRTGDHNNVTEGTPHVEGANVGKDHFDYSFKNGKLNGISDLESYGLSSRLVESTGDLGITKKQLRKVIRAGRAVEMYSTIEVNLSMTSFTGNADLESKKNAFMGELVDTLENKGVNVTSGVLKNHKGDSKVVAKLDKDRRETTYGGVKYQFSNKSEGYMYKKVGPTKKVSYGEDACARVDVFTKTYKFVIPVTTHNIGGDQVTDQGEFGDDYEVGDGKDSFYTDINTPNGQHKLAFGFYMKPKALDSKLGNKTYCESPSEMFEVKGNIYDDVRSEEVEIDKDHDDDWDF